MGVRKNGWFIRGNPTKMDDFKGYPHFRKPPYEYGETWVMVNQMERYHAALAW